MKRVTALALLVLAGGTPDLATSSDPILPPQKTEVDGAPISPRNVLKYAFENQYEVDTTSNITLVIHDRRGQTRERKFEAVQKIIDNRVHSIGRLTAPEYLRDMAILQIEEPNHSHNAFIYLPSMKKTRRISTQQRGDAFFGTDITYEDLERRYVDDYEIVDFANDRIRNEPVYVVRARPTRDVSYAEVAFAISAADFAILRTDYFKRGALEPYRSLVVHRTNLIELDGHTLPTRVTVRNFTRGTRTEVTFTDFRVNPPIDDRLFSVRTLEQQRDLDKAY